MKTFRCDQECLLKGALQEGRCNDALSRSFRPSYITRVVGQCEFSNYFCFASDYSIISRGQCYFISLSPVHGKLDGGFVPCSVKQLQKEGIGTSPGLRSVNDDLEAIINKFDQELHQRITVSDCATVARCILVSWTYLVHVVDWDTAAGAEHGRESGGDNSAYRPETLDNLPDVSRWE